MTVAPQTPRLRATTHRLDEIPDLIDLADPHEPLLWHRGDRGCVGIGEVLRLSFGGPDRFIRAAQRWREISARAEIRDEVRLPGTGLVALGTFAFDDFSTAESVLVVPRLLIARHRGVAWATEIELLASDAASDAPAGKASARTAPAIPRPAPASEWQGVAFERSPETSNPSVDAYLDGVRQAVARIESRAAEKIVLARRITAEISADADLRVPLRRLAERYLDCWTFAIDGLIGASPETLIRSTGGAVSARVLAGTRGRHAEDAQRDARARDELLTSDKEQHEHAFAVQSVVTALSPHVREMRTSEEPFPLRLPNVWHLATDLGASLGERSSALELVGALHPTAAVAGTPTVDAVEAIRELEPFDRERYTGAVGWIDAAGDGEWVIALRCAQIDDASEAGQSVPGSDAVASGSPMRSITASAGGGIVVGSDPANELRETVSKFRPIVEAFGD